MEKKHKATHQGDLDLNGFILSCAVLDDENKTRVFSERTIATAFGIKGGGAYWEKKKKGSAVLPEYISASYLKPFISKELEQKFDSAFLYSSKANSDSNGIEVTVLPDICDVYIQAKNSGNTNPNILKAADIAYTLIKGFAKVGIIALVDEATGYQFDREKDELRKILKKYISAELLPWEKRFPDEFYREIFRLNNWYFTVPEINKASRPGIIGTWTKKYIYSVLPKGVLEALLNKSERNEKGKLKSKLHQRLTREEGIEHLNKQIVSVVTLMNVSDNWKQFDKIWNKKFGQQQLFYDEMLMIEPPKSKIELSSFNENIKKGLEFDPNNDK